VPEIRPRLAILCRSCAIAAWLAAAGTEHVFAQTIGANFSGINLAIGKQLINNANGYAPPDNDGAVGPNHVAQLINGGFAVFNKSGTALKLESGRQFWIDAGLPDPGNSLSNLGVFNQRILYDPTTSQWIAAALTGDPTNNKVLIARSDTSDPTGPWKAVSFVGNVGGPDQFADFTTLGVDANGVYVTTNNFPSLTVGGFDSVSVFSLPKADLLQSTPSIARLSRFDAQDSSLGTTLQAVTDFGPAKSTAPILATFPVNGANFVLRSDLSGTAGAGATLTTDPTVITTSAYNNPPAAAQPDATRTISTIDARITSNVYEVNGLMYAVHSTSVGGNAALHWLKIDEHTNQVVQEGTISDANFDYFFPSIAVNSKGDVVIAYTRSGFGPDGVLSDFALVGHTQGGVTTFGTPLLLKASTVGNYHFQYDRWGDYSTTVVDPANDDAFWTFQQYANGSASWSTRITEIFVPEPGGLSTAGVALAAFSWAVWRRRTVGRWRQRSA
jgi:hypothetical protein